MKLRNREVKQFARSHTDNKHMTLPLNPGLLFILTSIVFNHCSAV